MIDNHLTNVALAGLGIGAAAVVLLGAAVIAIAAIWQHGMAKRRQHAATAAGPASRRASRLHPKPALRSS